LAAQEITTLFALGARVPIEETGIDQVQQPLGNGGGQMFLGDGDPVALPELADFVKAVLEQVRVQGLEFDAVVQQILNNAAAGLPVARQEGLEVLAVQRFCDHAPSPGNGPIARFRHRPFR
jgi:hypothetical protein